MTQPSLSMPPLPFVVFFFFFTVWTIFTLSEDANTCLAQTRTGEESFKTQTLQVFPATSFSISTSSQNVIEIMISPLEDINKALLHLFYRPKDSPTDPLSGQTLKDVPSHAFAARYGNRWFLIGTNGKADYAEGKIFLLKSAEEKGNKIIWEFSSSTLENPCLIFVKNNGQWQAVRKLIPGKKEPTNFDEADAVDPSTSLSSPLNLPDQKVLPKINVSSMKTNERVFCFHLDITDAKHQLILIAELRRVGSKIPQQRVPLVIVGNGKQRLCFKAPLMGWVADRYLIELKHGDRSLLTKEFTWGSKNADIQ